MVDFSVTKSPNDSFRDFSTISALHVLHITLTSIVDVVPDVHPEEQLVAFQVVLYL